MDCCSRRSASTSFFSRRSSAVIAVTSPLARSMHRRPSGVTAQSAAACWRFAESRAVIHGATADTIQCRRKKKRSSSQNRVDDTARIPAGMKLSAEPRWARSRDRLLVPDVSTGADSRTRIFGHTKGTGISYGTRDESWATGRWRSANAHARRAGAGQLGGGRPRAPEGVEDMSQREHDSARHRKRCIGRGTIYMVACGSAEYE